MSFLLVLSTIGSLSAILPATIGVFRSRSLDNKLRLLLFYCSIIAIKEIVSVFLAQNGYRNLEVYNISNIVDSIPLFLIYYLEFSNKTLKKTIIIFIAIPTLFSIYNIISLQGYEVFNTYSISIVNLFKILATLLYFYNILKKAENLNLIKTPLFWISSGLLIYSVGTFLIFSLYDVHLQFPTGVRRLVWSINSLLYIFLNIIFSIAFLCQPKTKTY